MNSLLPLLTLIGGLVAAPAVTAYFNLRRFTPDQAKSALPFLGICLASATGAFVGVYLIVMNMVDHSLSLTMLGAFLASFCSSLFVTMAPRPIASSPAVPTPSTSVTAGDEERLGQLAMTFRSSHDDAARKAVARDYAETVDRLIASDKWNEVPAPEDQLPDEYMPKPFFDYWL